MVDIRIGNKDLVMPGRIPFTRGEVTLRMANPGVTRDQLVAAMKKNANDDILFESDAGDLYVASAGTLAVSWSIGLPIEGERFEAGSLQGTVSYVDDVNTLGDMFSGGQIYSAAFATVAGVALGFYHSGSNLSDPKTALVATAMGLTMGLSELGIEAAFRNERDDADPTLAGLTTPV